MVQQACGHCIECCYPKSLDPNKVVCLELPVTLRRGMRETYTDEWTSRATTTTASMMTSMSASSGKRLYMQSVEYRSLRESQDIMPSAVRQRRGLPCLGLIQLPRKCTNVDPKRSARVLAVPPPQRQQETTTSSTAAASAELRYSKVACSSSARTKRLKKAAVVDACHRPFMTGSKVGISYFLNPAISMTMTTTTEGEAFASLPSTTSALPWSSGPVAQALELWGLNPPQASGAPDLRWGGGAAACDAMATKWSATGNPLEPAAAPGANAAAKQTFSPPSVLQETYGIPPPVFLEQPMREAQNVYLNPVTM